MKPVVSIIICTRDRADSLRETLASVARSEVPPDLPTELLVVDNGLTDHTRKVVEQVGLANMPVRYIQEEKKGLSNARNRALAEAAGEVFLWTDDDVRVPNDWIGKMCKPLLRGDAELVAGAVRFPPEHERLLDRKPLCEWRDWFAATDGIDSRKPTRMVGANMALHRRVLNEVEAFDVNLGAGALGAYEETLLAWQLLDVGLKMVYLPHVAVEHHFDVSRLTRESVLATAARMGRSEAYVGYHWHHWDLDELRVRRPRVLRARLGVYRRRLMRPGAILGAQVQSWEIEGVRWVATLKQLLELRGQPRRYMRRGGATAPDEPLL